MYRKRQRLYSAPVALTTSVEQQTGQKAITLSGREFISDVVASALAVPASATAQSQFQTASTKINPSDSVVFSWLSSIANKFEEYRFNSVAFVYEPQCNTYSTGSVGIYFDPDCTNSPPATWQTFTNTGSNTHGAPWAKHVLVLPLRYLRDRRTYYVRDQFIDAATNPPVTPAQTQYIDPLEYFLGIIGTCSQGVSCQNTGAAPANVYNVLGKLYIDYSITLMKATLDSPPRTPQFGYGNATLTPANYKVGQSVSSYWASLSGNGFKIIPNAWMAPGADNALFGVSAPTTAGVAGPMNAQLTKMYGDELFDWQSSISGVVGPPAVIARSGVRALQTLDLLYVVCLAASTALTSVKWAFQNSNSDVSTLSGYNESFKTAANAGGGVVACGTLHIQAGEAVSLIINCTGAPTAATSFIWFAPMTWGLDQ